MLASGSKPDLTAPKSNFRFTPKSGLNSDIALCPFCAKTGSQAYVEMLREAVLNPQDAHDAELSAEFVELMRKIAA
jgi:hypothetical protein